NFRRLPPASQPVAVVRDGQACNCFVPRALKRLGEFSGAQVPEVDAPGMVRDDNVLAVRRHGGRGVANISRPETELPAGLQVPAPDHPGLAGRIEDRSIRVARKCAEFRGAVPADVGLLASGQDVPGKDLPALTTNVESRPAGGDGDRAWLSVNRMVEFEE